MYKTLWLMVIQVGEKWCKATTTWKFWWNFLAKSLVFSRYPIFSPFQCTDAYKCYTFSESCGSRETKEIKISISKFDLRLEEFSLDFGPKMDPDLTLPHILSSPKHSRPLNIRFQHGFCIALLIKATWHIPWTGQNTALPIWHKRFGIL